MSRNVAKEGNCSPNAVEMSRLTSLERIVLTEKHCFLECYTESRKLRENSANSVVDLGWLHKETFRCSEKNTIALLCGVGC